MNFEHNSSDAVNPYPCCSGNTLSIPAHVNSFKLKVIPGHVSSGLAAVQFKESCLTGTRVRDDNHVQVRHENVAVGKFHSLVFRPIIEAVVPRNEWVNMSIRAFLNFENFVLMELVNIIMSATRKHSIPMKTCMPDIEERWKLLSLPLILRLVSLKLLKFMLNH